MRCQFCGRDDHDTCSITLYPANAILATTATDDLTVTIIGYEKPKPDFSEFERAAKQHNKNWKKYTGWRGKRRKSGRAKR